MASTGRAIGAVCVCALTLAGGPAGALTLEFPGNASQTGTRAEAMTTYRLPVGAWDGKGVPTQVTEGPMDQTAWRIDSGSMTSLDLLIPLRDQFRREGFSILFECESRACGGFDFRYGTDILPEPEMHVDLGDFRFLALSRDGSTGPEYASLIVSRSADQGFVQLTRIGEFARPAPQLALSTKTPVPDRTAIDGADIGAQDQPLGQQLETQGAVPLDDLLFPSGAGALAEGDYASLAELAEWLAGGASRKVALVGHTDASGSLEANSAISLQRAQSVRQTLISQYGVSAGQLVAQGVGYLSPRDTNQTPEGRERNRRVEAMLIDAP